MTKETFDQPALDMAEHAFELLNISPELWSQAELRAIGKDLLCYAASLTIVEELQNAKHKG